MGLSFPCHFPISSGNSNNRIYLVPANRAISSNIFWMVVLRFPFQKYWHFVASYPSFKPTFTPFSFGTSICPL
ncbi:hypothetical protein EUGRSUZ_G00826 [Eucalyptus grandis]|uniref:Uncharacterized protein n=2 Tax=Eucalyptus grandis TaxID=71139 RepID=A0ACC3K0N1_EUCGR|nr:hypothetical protein EUGRSUZ_G00826 [Eucalyptus grandis]